VYKLFKRNPNDTRLDKGGSSEPCWKFNLHYFFQVLQQFHRQPNTAHLSTAQLQSLAAVQQASIAAGRQTSSQNGTSSQQTGSTQATINLTTSPAAAQLISRAQSISSTPTSISQQAVLLGSQSSPTLTASQAQMYLRAQMVRAQRSHRHIYMSLHMGVNTTLLVNCVGK
uniref:Uncharacterized protein n=1 Tax=Oryzias latipes TaxID=8090 RepID=A0A3P9KSY1_ORYLA